MNYYAVERSTDHLAHYGVKGMRWGVRKAIAKGDTRAVEKHYAKAAKKLAKLQDIGLNSSKYAKRAAAYGTAAAGTGTIAIRPIVQGIRNFKKNSNVDPGKELLNLSRTPWTGTDGGSARSFGDPSVKIKTGKERSFEKSVQIASGIATLGLGTAAGLNAYRAANGPKYRQKAYEWKNAMDSAFEGTKYSGKYSIPKKKKRR